MVLTRSTGTALSTARSTCATVTIPGDKFRQINSAFGPRLVDAG